MRSPTNTLAVIPADAGIQGHKHRRANTPWIPTFVGMTMTQAPAISRELFVTTGP